MSRYWDLGSNNLLWKNEFLNLIKKYENMNVGKMYIILWYSVIYLIFICWRDFVSEHFQNSDQFSCSVVSTSDPMDCSTPGFPVYHQLLELAQTHVHRVGDTIQPSHPLSSPSLPAFSLSQHQDLFCWVSSSNKVAKVLEFQFQLQHQSFQWIFKTDFLVGFTGWISLQSKGLSRVFSNTTVQKHILKFIFLKNLTPFSNIIYIY